MICVFKCPHCGAKMRFSAETQSLVCDTCESEMPVSDYNEENISYEGAVSIGDDFSKMECPECGANVITKDNTATLKCGYCGTEMAALALGPGDIMPEKIIPLSITERQAQDHVIGWWLKHESMPELDFQKMKMEFHDIYIPVWLYDVSTVTSVQAYVSHMAVSANMDILSSNYKKRKSDDWGRTFKDYNKHSVFLDSNYQKASEVIAGIASGKEDYVVPGAFLDSTRSSSSTVYKKLESIFQKIPNIASSHFSSDRFHGIEPYNYYGLMKFKSAYLSGHQAENYEYKHDEILPYVTRRIKKYALEQCYTHVAGTVPGGEIVKVINESADSFPENVYYALVPLWVCSYYYGGKKHYLYVNGQTGKVDGEVLFNNKKYGTEIALASLTNIFTWVMLSLATGVLLFGFANAMIYVLYLLLWGMTKLGVLSGKNSATNLTEIEYFKNKKLNVKSYLLTKLGVGGGLLFINALMFLNGFFSVKGAASMNLFESVALGVIIAIVSTCKFAFKRRKDLMVKENVEYVDYIMEAGTRVIYSART